VPPEAVWGEFTNLPNNLPVAPPVPPQARVPQGYEPGKSRLVARDLNSDTYANPDGSHAVRIDASPRNVEVSPGRFEPADLSLVQAAEADVPEAGRSGEALKPGLRPVRHALAPVFSADGTGGLVALRRAEVSVRMEAAEGGPRKAPTKVPGTPGVRFEDASEASDVQYEMTAGSVKETIFVQDRAAAGDGVWSFWVDVRNGSLRLDADGGVSAVNASGETAMRMPIPYIEDSSSVPGVRGPADVNGRYTISRVSGRWLVQVHVATGWLDAPQRVYPVLVDPTWVAPGYDKVVAYKSDGTSNADGQIRIGSPDGHSWRTVMHWKYEQYLPAKVNIASAEVDYQYLAGDTTSRTAYLARAGSWSYSHYLYGLGSGPLGAGTLKLTDSRITNEFRTLFNNNEHNAGYMVSGTESSTTYTYKRIDASLWLGLNYTANSATLHEPANGATGQRVEPLLRASATDPDGDDQIYYYFRVSENPNPDVAPVVNQFGTYGGGSLRIPPRVLKGGTTYYWKVYTRDACHLVENPCGYGRTFHNESPVRSFTTNQPPDALSGQNTTPSGTLATLTRR